LVGLRKLLLPQRRRKKLRAEAPKTIVPPRDTPADRFDAARDRLRAQIPPPPDDD
jgi:hypothetical protein